MIVNFDFFFQFDLEVVFVSEKLRMLMFLDKQWNDYMSLKEIDWCVIFMLNCNWVCDIVCYFVMN